jgi:hypothetical protein
MNFLGDFSDFTVSKVGIVVVRLSERQRGSIKGVEATRDRGTCRSSSHISWPTFLLESTSLLWSNGNHSVEGLLLDWLQFVTSSRQLTVSSSNICIVEVVVV